MNGPRSSASPDGRERGVSEVVAFILVFAMILGGVGLLYATGFQAMENYQESEQLQNAERAMDALAENFNDVLRYGAIDQRYGELSLREGTVASGSAGTTLEINDSSGDTIESANLGEFTYTMDSNTIAYEGGGVVRGSEGGSVVLSRPMIQCADESAVISLVEIDADDRSLQSPSGAGFTISVDDRESDVYDVDEDLNVTVTDTDYERAWESILEHGDWSATTDDDTIVGTCEDVDRAVVTVVTADIEF